MLLVLVSTLDRCCPSIKNILLRETSNGQRKRYELFVQHGHPTERMCFIRQSCLVS